MPAELWLPPPLVLLSVCPSVRCIVRRRVRLDPAWGASPSHSSSVWASNHSECWNPEHRQRGQSYSEKLHPGKGHQGVRKEKEKKKEQSGQLAFFGEYKQRVCWTSCVDPDSAVAQEACTTLPVSSSSRGWSLCLRSQVRLLLRRVAVYVPCPLMWARCGALWSGALSRASSCLAPRAVSPPVELRDWWVHVYSLWRSF